MQTKSLNVAKLNYKARIQYIEQNILFKTLDEIATECRVNPRTIDRDIVKWKSKGGFDRFLDKEFFTLYGQEKLQNPSRALDRIVTLMIRRVPELETKAEAPHKLVIEIVDPKSPNQV
jgi:hypothetical protein